MVTTMTQYETVIGLEVHVQLNTKSKMFCRCSTDYTSAEPNTHVCPVCLGMPGVLPTINKQAVEYTIMSGLALGCDIVSFSKFDRKNYNYPDLMKGYQISQYDQPLCGRGFMDINIDGAIRRIGITRIHLEEDVAKLHHESDINGQPYSLLDINRSSIPLMEIVSEPDMRTPEEARQYLMKLRTIMRYLGVSTANMEDGSFRCDANISIRPAGSPELGAKVEVKNMNSFKAVFSALEYEEVRQRKMADEGKKISQETRGWQDDKCQTVSQRSKEFAHDYRYFPEPDLPPLHISCDWIEAIRAKLPELPEVRKERFIQGYWLSEYDASLLTASRELADYFEAVLSEADFQNIPQDKGIKEVANWVVGPVSSIMNTAGADINAFTLKVSPASLCHLLVLVSAGKVNATTAKAVLEDMYSTGQNAEAIIEKKGLSQISDSSELVAIAKKVLADNPKAVAEYNEGKTQVIGFLVGQMMKQSKGRANPNIAMELLKKALEEG
ncbi:MAG: Asp-tRNA(Asn)/Glu-tRNA(Gln) amidotransferase subunit GatB [Dehalococcoides mccartyi]|nr:Asp-tRNA(Asn)/Glu-tRNA(Gln) amidotransferase subunit GatB [Dehalococcoides mccartyi]MDP4279529.1 Asp-tRNA(Asn)/Glu-tRNA(Gln) amidotransferase subunit GatB [Dehalococcoides mccartyi]